MGFRFMSWNVKHFQAKDADRIQQVDQHIVSSDPDVFGILEFLAKDAARQIITNYEDYDFGMTDSDSGIEVLIGWKRGKFSQVMYTQRREFQAGNVKLRPGGLLSFREKGQNAFTNVLFLHTDSGIMDKDYESRQAMFKKVFSMKKAIEGLNIQNGKARFIMLGDLNTMGRKKSGDLSAITAADEITAIEESAAKAGMRVLSKSYDKTWSDGSGQSNLDHVIASNDLQFKKTSFAEGTFEIKVDGWNNFSGDARRDWIKNISDHCAIIGETL